MKSAALILAIAMGIILPAATAVAGAEIDPKAAAMTVISDAPNASPAFMEFFHEFNGMLVNWWKAGGRQATQGRWRVVATEMLRPGYRMPHFAVLVSQEKDKPRLVLTFFIPPFAQRNLFLAAHAAFDAAVGAVLGEIRDNREWEGMGGGETI